MLGFQNDRQMIADAQRAGVSWRLRAAALAIAVAVLALAGTKAPARAQSVRQGEPIQLRPPLTSEAAAPALTIEAAVDQAQRNFPQVYRRQAEVRAASFAVRAQQFAEYMPASNFAYQQSAGSHNRLSQSLFKNTTFPEMTGGATLFHDSFRPRTYSATGALLDWTPIDFGLHRARIAQAQTLQTQAQSACALTRFQAAENAANAFLNLIIAQQEVLAANSTVNRFQILFDIVHSLVKSGLRPGVDEQLARAQLVQAQNNLLRAQQNEEFAEADLAEQLGTPESLIVVDPHPIADVSEPPVLTVATPALANHPLAVLSQSTIGTLAAAERVYRRSYDPVIHWMGDLNFRGSGIGKSGLNQKYTAYGLSPSISNWLVGVEVDFPFLDWFRIRQQTLAQAQRVTAERYNYQAIIQSLQAADRRSRAQLRAAIRIAENMPVQVAAAQEAELRARTRYRAGLASIADVAETENVLTETLVEQAVARVGVWKALLAQSDARGDMQPFLAQVGAARNRGM
jgi:outer membrane protein TolC